MATASAEPEQVETPPATNGSGREEIEDSPGEYGRHNLSISCGQPILEIKTPRHARERLNSHRRRAERQIAPQDKTRTREITVAKRMDDDARYEIVRQVQKIREERNINAVLACKEIGVAPTNYYKWAAQLEAKENAQFREAKMKNGDSHTIVHEPATPPQPKGHPKQVRELEEENGRLRVELELYRRYLLDLLLGNKTPAQILQEQMTKLR